MDRPNILWICTDQQRWDTIRALGNSHIRTPNIDRLCAEGTAFTHTYCQNPICTPSRASFLTGMYPSTVHGCGNGNEAWSEAAPLVTKLLKDGGYDGGLVGKLHLSGCAGRVEPRPKDDGYRVFHWSHSPHDNWPEGHAYIEWVRKHGVDPQILNDDPMSLSPEHHQTRWCAEMAIDFMKEKRDQPWFFSVNIFDPHPPFDPPREYLDRYDPAAMPGPLFRPSDLEAQEKLAEIDFQTYSRPPEEFGAKEKIAAYYAMIEQIDDAVGRMLAALEETGQAKNTIVVFMSDHGEMLGDHGLLRKGCRFYDGLVRVPLVIRYPGHVRAGLVNEALVELTDVAPTLLDYAGLPAPERMQGRSLRAQLEETAAPAAHREFVRCEFYRSLSKNPDGWGVNKRKLQIKGRSDMRGTYATMIRDRRHKLVVYHGHTVGELFDMEKDPGEFDNLWDSPDHADIRSDLMKQSFDALAFAVDTGPEQKFRF